MKTPDRPSKSVGVSHSYKKPPFAVRLQLGKQVFHGLYRDLHAAMLALRTLKGKDIFQRERACGQKVVFNVQGMRAEVKRGKGRFVDV